MLELTAEHNEENEMDEVFSRYQTVKETLKHIKAGSAVAVIHTPGGYTRDVGGRKQDRTGMLG